MSRRKQAKPRPLQQPPKELAAAEAASEAADTQPEEVTVDGSADFSDSTTTHSDDEDSTSSSMGSSSTCNSDQFSPLSEESNSEFTIGVTESTPYGCQFCERAFGRMGLLKRHEQTHTSQLPFRCNYCQRLFKHKRSRDRHLKLHTGDKKYACPHCSSAFSRSDHLKIHLKTHDQQKPYQCTTCNRGYNTAAALTSHMQNHKKSEKYKCGLCASAGFTNSAELQMHMTSSHPAVTPTGRLDCIYCSLEFGNIESLQLHVEAVHGSEILDKLTPNSPPKDSEEQPTDLSTNHRRATPTSPSLSITPPRPIPLHSNNSISLHNQFFHSTTPTFTCTICPQTFSNAEDLSNHILTHYTIKSKTYNCSSCGKYFSKPDELQKHLLDIHAHHLYKCGICKELFDSKVGIQVHFAVGHSDEGMILRCGGNQSACSTVFLTESDLKHHVHSVHLTPPVVTPPPPALTQRCLFCTETFTSALDFQYHLQTHKTFKCKLCEESFHVEFLLDKHLETHLLDKKDEKKKSVVSLTCAYCQDGFKSRGELESHMKASHGGGGGGKNKCNICDEVFPTHTALVTHKLTHCKTPNNCATCKAPISTKSTYMNHNTLHNKSYPLPCVVCRQTLTTDLELNLHADFHSTTTPNQQEQTYQCISCEENFKTEVEIQNHVVKNHLSGSKTICNLCKPPEQLETPLKLQKHLIEHTFEGCVLRCYICSCVFTTSGGLLGHMLGHGLKSRPYDCEKCGLKFFFALEVENHLKSGGCGGGSAPGNNSNNNNKRKFFYRSDSEGED